MSRVTTIVDAEVAGNRVDVRIEGDVIVAVDVDLPRRGTDVVEAHGAALLPGLHDHHLHLLAMAALERSVDLSGLAGPAELDRALVDAHDRATGDAWLRVVGYDDRHGPLDDARLEALAPGRRVRVQHRSGAAWMLSPAARGGPPTIEGAVEPPSGWIFREDDALAAAWADDERIGEAELRDTAARLARHGVTGVTDATPFRSDDALHLLAAARAGGAVPQRVVVTGGLELSEMPATEGLDLGPVKLVVGDHDLPDPDVLADALRRAHRAGRPVAVHCVTRIALVLALVAWEQAGASPGDRVEHASVVPVELIGRLRDLGLTVVTQPRFLPARGDLYRSEVDAEDVEHLYRCGSLQRAGIGVAGSTDAPFGPEDPWLAMRAAVDRRTRSGVVLGADDRIAPHRALALFLGAPDAPAGPPRRLAPGDPADLCLLDVALDRALDDLSSEHVRATWIAGSPVHGDV